MGNVCSCLNTATQLGFTCWDRTIRIRRLGENLESLQTKMDELDRVYNDVNQHHVEEARRNRWSLQADADGWLNRVNDYREEVQNMKDEGEQMMGSCCCLRSVFNCNCYALHELSRHAENKKAELQRDLDLGRTLAADKNKVAFEPPVMTLKHILEKIGRKKDDLKAVFEDMKGKVEAEERRHQDRTNQVDRWMKRVELLMEDADEILREGEQVVQNHHQGTEGSVSQSDQRNAELLKTIERAKRLKANLDEKLEEHRNIGEVAHKSKEPLILELPLDTTVGAESLFEEVWDWAYQDESVRCIGLYGMGGVGKTTLLNKVHNRFAEVDHHYSFVFRVVVSRPLDLDKIQKDIWTDLNLLDDEWKNKRDRASRAAVVLSKLKGKNFLLFLDDLWDEINLLEDIGIPRSSCDHHPNKCMIIFTTRDQKVCEKMKPDKKMKVECLPRDKACELFKLRVGLGEEFWKTNPGIWEIAEELVEECKDLPLAIITVASAMSGTTEHREWVHAKEELKTRLSGFEDMPKKVLETLKFSYDRLPDETHKKCFLYLSIFPEDHVMLEDEAIGLWVGEGFVQNIVHGKRILTRLGQASLVESVGRYHFKMHDLVREMAVWVYNKSEGGQNENRVLVQVGSLQAGELTKWKNAERISVWRVPDDGLRRRTLSTVPSCRSLSTLILRETELREIPDVLFRSMPQLRFLDLQRNYSLKRLPDSIWTLRELRYLNLLSTNIRVDVKWRKIEDLNKLEVLMLPRKATLLMGKKTEAEAPKSRLPSLRIFHWYGIFSEFKPDMRADETKVLDVLLRQGMLEEIEITLCSPQGVAKLMKSSRLHSHLRRMGLDGCDGLGSLEFSSSSNSSSSGGFEHLEALALNFCRIQEIKINDQVSFEGLRAVGIRECDKIKDLTQLIYHAPSLETLSIDGCREMTKVIDDGDNIEDSHVTIGSRPFFSCLRVLQVMWLPKLESICTRALPFPALEYVNVRECPKLKKLPLDGNSAKHTLQVITGEQRWWDTLEWEDPTSKQVLSPKFERDDE